MTDRQDGNPKAPIERISPTWSGPDFVKVLARDVGPYRYGVWSSVANGDPFVNQIVYMRWSDNGEHLWFGLESHNTKKARPDEVLELVEMSSLGAIAKKKAEEWVLPPRPFVDGGDPLAIRAVKCKRWSWELGMLPRDANGRPDFWRPRVGAERTAPKHCLPDFTDDATIGALRGLVRQVYHDPNKLWDGWVMIQRDQHSVFFAVQPYHTEDGALEWRSIGTGETEVEALVAALESAPEDKSSELQMRKA